MEKIVRMDHNGRGICYYDGIITFVKNALPEEMVELKIVKKKKKFQEAIATKVENPSKDRVKPQCPYYGICGGCNLMHFAYQAQLDYKLEKGLQLLKKFAHIEIEDAKILHAEPFFYRNKVVFHVEHGKLGFYMDGSHDFVEVKECQIIHPKMNQLLTEIKKLSILKSVEKVMIRVFDTTDMSQIVFYPQENFSYDAVIHSLKDKVTSIYVNGKCISGEKYIEEQVNDFTYAIYPNSFFQVNTNAMKLLYDEIVRGLDPQAKDKVLDLYCGAGTIGLYFAQQVKHVYGIELNHDAIKSAKKNKQINHQENMTFYEGDTHQVLQQEKITANKIVLDPPRSGLDEKTRNELLNLDVEKIVYVSCDPVTLARDMFELKEKYDIESVCFVDLFPNTDDVETVLTMKRKDVSL